METINTYLSNTLAQLGIDGHGVFLGNTMNEYAVAIILFFGTFFAVHFIQWVILRWVGAFAKRTKTELDDIFVKIFSSFKPPFYAFFAFWLATRSLAIVGIADIIITSILIIWIIYQTVTAIGIIVEEIVFKHITHDRDPTIRSALRLVVTLAKGAFWGIGFILLLSNLGVDVGALLAGVGVGGIAIAFALQGILADLFSSFSLYFDKPFRIGDFIIAGETMGVVKHIGFRSTRVTALSGEEVIIPNQDLAKVRIQNYKRMQERRVVFSFGITYETPVEKCRRVPQIVRDTIEALEKTRFDRAHLFKFGDSSYDFEVVYYVLDADYTTYMNIQQEINFALIQHFTKESINFAYPTRTLHMTSKTLELNQKKK